MIVLHQFPAPEGHTNLSGFCLKLECWLKLAGLRYRVEAIEDLSGAPKGQAPWITLPDGTALGDTGLIIAHLKRISGVDPDAHLTAAQRGTARAVAALCEERLYHAILRFRWIEDAGWAQLKDMYFGDIPEPMRTQIADGLRAQTRAKLHAHGYGRHSAAEVLELAAADIQALSDILDDRPWLFGERPSTADCAAWAMVASLLTPLFDTPLRDLTARHANLTAYHRWGLTHWFPALAGARRCAA